MSDDSTTATEVARRAAVLAGDAAVWEDWVNSHYCRVAGYVRWRCGGRDELSEESLQETWMVAARRLRTFDPRRGRFEGWVLGLAGNVVRNQLRSRRRRLARHPPLTVEPATPAPRDGEAVAAALAGLSEAHEQVLREKYLDGLSVREIAAGRGVSEKSVESSLSRAREAFRAAYRHETGEA